MNDGDYKHLTATEKTNFDNLFSVGNAYNIVQKDSSGNTTSSLQTSAVKMPTGTTETQITNARSALASALGAQQG